MKELSEEVNVKQENINATENRCLIDYLSFTIPHSTSENVITNILKLDYEHFTKFIGSSFNTYDGRLAFADMKIHTSTHHSNILVDFSAKACRQYEEYMSVADGWTWYEFIKAILENRGKPSRIDLALDIFDESSPSVKQLQDYVKRGQLSTRSQRFRENNGGRTLDGKLDGHTLYIGASPQMLRIYDKVSEMKAKGKSVDVDKWVRWELHLSGKKAMTVIKYIADGVPLNNIIRGILNAHYSFKTQQKGKIDYNNKSKWSTMRWWDKFIEDIPKIPLRTEKKKLTMANTEQWIQDSVSKPLAMQLIAMSRVFGNDDAKQYMTSVLTHGKNKINHYDEAVIEQYVRELQGTKDYAYTGGKYES